jgi:hypothetical protein
MSDDLARRLEEALNQGNAKAAVELIKQSRINMATFDIRLTKNIIPQATPDCIHKPSAQNAYSPPFVNTNYSYAPPQAVSQSYNNRANYAADISLPNQKSHEIYQQLLGMGFPDGPAHRAASMSSTVEAALNHLYTL